MNKINEIALRVARRFMINLSPETVKDHAHALLAELSKDAEPVAWANIDDPDDEGFILDKPSPGSFAADWTPLYTHPLPTAEIEQRVAEAIAKMARSHMAEPECPERAAYIADDIESGKWREYL